MSDDQWVMIDEVPGTLQAELLRGLFEAQGLPVLLSQEGAGHAFALTVGAMGRVQILVPAPFAERAREVLEQYYAGEFADRGPAIDPRSDWDTPIETEE